MECGDYKGTIDFLDDFNRSQKTFKAFRTIINNIKEDSLSEVLNDKIVITVESLFIEIKKEKEQRPQIFLQFDILCQSNMNILLAV